MCSPAQSGGAVSGTVTGPDGQPLSGVVVAVPDLVLAVATNAAGHYVLDRVPAGYQVLRFHRVGYAPHEVPVDVIGDTSLTANAVLDPQPIELGTVLVEGVSRAPDRIIDAPAAVEVVVAEKVAKVPKLEGGLWHPYRRKWATERKGHSLKDVAAAGGWQDTETLLKCYQRPHNETLLAVMSEERKLREVTAEA